MYSASEKRYSEMIYRRCGNSGLKLPAVSLGFWHNFGDFHVADHAIAMMRTAFDLGVTHFDLANNYGPAPGSAEETFGRIFKNDFRPYRDELIVSTKAGYEMWPGPYGGCGGSKKYLAASLDQSLKRMGLEYVDIFYHHRPDPETDLTETACALDLLVRQGKALYVGISNYSAEETAAIVKIFRELKTPFVIHQVRYSMMDRRPEQGLMAVLKENGVGCIAFSPLEQGILSDRYLNGIPQDSRAGGKSVFLNPEKVQETLTKVKSLNTIAKKRGQTLAEMAVAWLLKEGSGVTSVLVGASSPAQIKDNVAALTHLDFSCQELKDIDAVIFDRP